MYSPTGSVLNSGICHTAIASSRLPDLIHKVGEFPYNQLQAFCERYRTDASDQQATLRACQRFRLVNVRRPGEGLRETVSSISGYNHRICA